VSKIIPVIEDCIHMGGIENIIHLRQEMSLYADGKARPRPDAIIMRTKNKLPVGAIEVKKMERNMSGAFLHSQQILGQAYKCLHSMRVYYGVCDAFVIITNYQHTRIVWLPGTTDEVAAATKLVPIKERKDADERKSVAAEALRASEHEVKREMLKLKMKDANDAVKLAKASKSINSMMLKACIDKAARAKDAFESLDVPLLHATSMTLVRINKNGCGHGAIVSSLVAAATKLDLEKVRCSYSDAKYRLLNNNNIH
jgi:hypothetical protein